MFFFFRYIGLLEGLLDEKHENQDFSRSRITYGIDHISTDRRIILNASHPMGENSLVISPVSQSACCICAEMWGFSQPLEKWMVKGYPTHENHCGEGLIGTNIPNHGIWREGRRVQLVSGENLKKETIAL